ncbi:hypothetical protein A2T98_09165 [Nodularia spumigena CENA596]|jgi:hypothetical protein|uniref:Uncharacterized protein n=1 Tax=Nodularia spumigena CENA596 TaxID=1819295 RepID=A0A166JTM0_NODSP|nr:hypothetical protein N9414_18318 [Nodularia spumigena CCY9414]KZL50111.1 hypothetical protein A2T98_09165 [Nodularia spumigena CENA596]
MAGNTIPTGVAAKIICKGVLLFIDLVRGIHITELEARREQIQALEESLKRDRNGHQRELG